MKKLYSLIAVACLALNAHAAPLCTPTFTSSASSCSTYMMNISQFHLSGSSGTIFDTSGCDGSGYLNCMYMSCSVAPAASYTASIATGTSTYMMNCQTWIDFNDDSTYQTTETVGGLNNYSGPTAVTYTIAIPATAATGTHLMRTLSAYYGSSASYPSLNPCGGYYYGEARDYKITISGSSSSCSGTPSGGTATASASSSCGTYGLTLTNTGYTSGTGISLQWQSSPTGTSSWSNISGATNATEYMPAPTATTYYQCVVTCSSSSISANSTTSSLVLDRVAGHISYSAAAPDTLSLKVWLIYHNTSAGTLTAVDSVITCLDSLSPYYEFNAMGTGNYLVKAQSLDYTSSTPGTSGFVPTYGASSTHWSGGTTVSHTAGSTDTLHITRAYGTVTSGPGFIGGYISSGAGKGTASDIPAANMLVYLQNASSGVVTFTYTNASGNYAFSGVANGTYTIYPEVLDYTTTPSATLTLSAGHETINAVNFKQYNNSKTIKPVVSAIPTVTGYSPFGIYPNPVNDVLNISWGSQNFGNADVTILDITGREVYSQALNITAGTDSTPIDLRAISNGIYILKIQSAAINHTQKLEIAH